MKMLRRNTIISQHADVWLAKLWSPENNCHIKYTSPIWKPQLKNKLLPFSTPVTMLLTGCHELNEHTVQF